MSVDAITTTLGEDSSVEKIIINKPDGLVEIRMKDLTTINYLPFNGNLIIEPRKVHEKTKSGIYKSPAQVAAEKKTITSENTYKVVAIAQDIIGVRPGDVIYLLNDTNVEEVKVGKKTWWSINFFSIMGKAVKLNDYK